MLFCVISHYSQFFPAAARISKLRGIALNTRCSRRLAPGCSLIGQSNKIKIHILRHFIACQLSSSNTKPSWFWLQFNNDQNGKNDHWYDFYWNVGSQPEYYGTMMIIAMMAINMIDYDSKEIWSSAWILRHVGASSSASKASTSIGLAPPPAHARQELLQDDRLQKVIDKDKDKDKDRLQKVIDKDKLKTKNDYRRW